MLMVFNTYNYNSILISKLMVLNILPKINKVIIFIIIHNKLYKKSLILFYLVSSFIFGGFSPIHLFKKELSYFQITVKFSLKRLQLYSFICSFINIYLPLIGTADNITKYAIYYNRFIYSDYCYYRINYFTFPFIPEMNLIYSLFNFIYDVIIGYKFQIDFFIYKGFCFTNSGESLIRMYRFPFKLKNKFCYIGVYFKCCYFV